MWEGATTEPFTKTSLTGNSWQNLKHYYIYGIPEALAAATTSTVTLPILTNPFA